ncbi:unnamed protein product [Fraxinus pennsylvanica]|uniref:Uncharacterized protein n=1 Tax=Fraxinus pennsylvanica TaxID=56036 RepID=A0AAD2AFX7_9LAMI|nr:unnamed protein product [Fraxinus pennsylvanica]
MRNAILVVVVLIATATFQTTLTPPFGNSHNDTTPVLPSITSVYNDTTSHNDTTPVFPNITFVYNGTTSTNSTSTKFKKTTQNHIIMINSIAFALAMGTCTILTLDVLQFFLLLPLHLFLVDYLALASGIYPSPFINFAVPLLVILPILVMLPWTIIIRKAGISSGIYHEINLDEAKFRIFALAYGIFGGPFTVLVVVSLIALSYLEDHTKERANKSPLHLALGNGHTNTVRRLVKHDPELIRVQGREGITLLHYAVEKEEIDLLIYFLLICPLSLFDLTVRDETVVHIAVRNNNVRAFMVLFGWARRTDKMSVMRWRNEEGNTVMHLAALTSQTEVCSFD